MVSRAIALDVLEQLVSGGVDVLDSELSLASSSGIVWISMVWFWNSSAACFSSASAARAVMHAFSTALLSRSCRGGSGSSWL
jgi:hypothetical protein